MLKINKDAPLDFSDSRNSHFECSPAGDGYKMFADR